MKSTIYVLAGIALVGCGSGGGGYKPEVTKPVEKVSLEAGQEQSLFPMAKGNQWTFSIDQTTSTDGQTQKSEGEVTFRIADVIPTGDGTKGILEIVIDGKVADKQTWMVNSKGIYQVAMGNATSVPFVPIQPAVVFPLEEKKEFLWKGTGITPVGKAGTSTIKSRILGMQEVDLEKDRVMAYAVESAIDGKIGAAPFACVTTTWWQPKVGFVRLRQTLAMGKATQIQTLRLKSYSPASK